MYGLPGVVSFKTVGLSEEAARVLSKAERDTGTFVEPGKETLAEYMDEWLNTVVKARVREVTYRDYLDRTRLYIKPALGELRLPQVTPDGIQALYSKMLESGLSPRSVRYVHAILRNALQQAVKWGKLYRNPADLVDLPRQKKEEMKVLTPAEAARFMDAVIYSPWKAFFSLLLSSGMRPSEALGLKWPDIDFEGGKITVNRSLTRPRGAAWVLDETKTNKSRRTIPLPASVMADLREHKADQSAVKLKKKKGGQYNDMGFVFTSENGEPARDNNLLKRHFKPLLKDAGLPDIRLYDLRHTCATLLLAAGENPKVVSERLGHASISLTLDTYSHVLPDMQKAATEKLETMLFKGGTQRHTK
ncbi:MAG: site-specific integrase [Dethiobacter sp.]|nr:site-specific integrase [Dethiobacter sp.]